jgi:hypothetical protein
MFGKKNGSPEGKGKTNIVKLDELLTPEESTILGDDHMKTLTQYPSTKTSDITALIQLARDMYLKDAKQGFRELAKLTPSFIEQLINQPTLVSIMRQYQLSFVHASLPLIFENKKTLLAEMIAMGVFTAEELIKLDKKTLNALNKFSLTTQENPTNTDSLETKKIRAACKLILIAEGADALFSDNGLKAADQLEKALAELQSYYPSQPLPSGFLAAATEEPGIWRGMHLQAPILQRLLQHADNLSSEALGTVLEEAMRGHFEPIYSLILGSPALLAKLPQRTLDDALLDFVCLNHVGTARTILTNASATLFSSKALGEAYYQSAMQMSQAVLDILNNRYIDYVPQKDRERALRDLLKETEETKKIVISSLPTLTASPGNIIRGHADLHPKSTTLHSNYSRMAGAASTLDLSPLQLAVPSEKRSPTLLGVPSPQSTPRAAEPCAASRRNSMLVMDAIRNNSEDPSIRSHSPATAPSSPQAGPTTTRTRAATMSGLQRGGN